MPTQTFSGVYFANRVHDQVEIIKVMLDKNEPVPTYLVICQVSQVLRDEKFSSKKMLQSQLKIEVDEYFPVKYEFLYVTENNKDQKLAKLNKDYEGYKVLYPQNTAAAFVVASTSSVASSVNFYPDKKRKIENNEEQYTDLSSYYKFVDPNYDLQKASKEPFYLSLIDLHAKFKFVIDTSFDDGLLVEDEREEKLIAFSELLIMIKALQEVFSTKEAKEFFANKTPDQFEETINKLREICKSCKDSTTKELINKQINDIDGLFKHNLVVTKNALNNTQQLKVQLKQTKLT